MADSSDVVFQTLVFQHAQQGADSRIVGAAIQLYALFSAFKLPADERFRRTQTLSDTVDTTMGLTPLEGLVMGTRCGNVDPNVFSFLNKTYGYSMEEITDILNKKSGLLGISELSNDCRAIEEACAEGNKQAQLAMDVFCYVLAKQLAGLAVATGGIDALAFTGGIGENSDVIRGKVLEMLGFLGFELDQQRNLDNRFGHEGVITSDASKVTAIVVATNEELMIAKDTAALIA